MLLALRMLRAPLVLFLLDVGRARGHGKVRLLAGLGGLVSRLMRRHCVALESSRGGVDALVTELVFVFLPPWFVYCEIWHVVGDDRSVLAAPCGRIEICRTALVVWLVLL